MTKKSLSPEDVFADLSDDASRLSGEVLAANVLAATVISCIGVDDAIAERARALLAQIKLEGGEADVVAAAEARLGVLLSELKARQQGH